MEIINLRCEYACNPIGLDIAAPQFSWEIKTNNRGMLQSAYQITVACSSSGLAEKKDIVWDSGKVMQRKSAGVRYNGPALESRKRYYWKVMIWDINNIAAESNEIVFFEMGLLQPADWKAEWIGCPASWVGRVLYFRRSFSIDKKVVKSSVYIAGIGYYILYLNGNKVGDHVLDPAISDYSKRVYYVTYDIKNLLQPENAFGIVVGPGWYGMPKLRMQAEFFYEDGTTETIASCWDPYHNWLVSTGPIITSSIFDGELYDARLERAGWATAAYNVNTDDRTAQWINAVVTDAPGGKMVSQFLEPIKIVETIAPHTIHETQNGIYVLDAGRNLAGWASVKITGKRGTRITLKFAESLHADGTVNQNNLRAAAAQDTYILKGDAEEQWEPSFTYHGFRYVQVEGFPYKPQNNDIQIKVVRSAVIQSGIFKCSNPLLNRIHQMVYHTEASNLHSIPTDCPQRDERMGWLNDMTVRIDQAIYNFNVARFYNKWIFDIKDTQADDGSITDTAPFRWGFRPADPVSVSYLLLALRCYEFYGNERMIAEHYDGLKAWVHFLQSKTENGIVNYSYWGDWSPPEAFGTPGSVGSGAVSAYTPGKFISTGYLFYYEKIMAQLASIIGNTQDEKYFLQCSHRTAAVFNATYWDEKSGGYGSNNQACNSFALFLGLVKEENITSVVNNLKQNVEAHEFHLTTGNLCTKYLLEMLPENGHAETAYKIAVQETYPSWGYMIANDATTLWERWENKTGGEMNSHNHPMMGSIGSWFYKYAIGITPLAGSNAFESLIIKPIIFKELDFASGAYHSVKGIIKSAWRKEEGYLLIDITIPANTKATVFIPAQNKNQITESEIEIDLVKEIKFVKTENNCLVFEVGSGAYYFEVAMAF